MPTDIGKQFVTFELVQSSICELQTRRKRHMGRLETHGAMDKVARREGRVGLSPGKFESVVVVLINGEHFCSRRKRTDV